MPQIREILASHPVGLITDIDGTISHIAPRQEDARISEQCRKSLVKLTSHLHLLAFITGRSSTNAKDMIGIQNALYLGNHGLDRFYGKTIETDQRCEQFIPYMQMLLRQLGPTLNTNGVVIEDKGVSVGIHYRQCDEPAVARKHILDTLYQITDLEAITITEGKKIVEIRPNIGTNKGTSLKRLMEEFDLRGILYLGDDIADVEAFKTLRRLTMPNTGNIGLAIGVLGDESVDGLDQEADMLLTGVEETEQLLESIAGLYESN